MAISSAAAQALLCKHDIFLALIVEMQGLTALEWQTAHAAAEAAGGGGGEMADLMSKHTCMLVMDWVPGGELLKSDGPFLPARVRQTACDLGRCVT